ncbi:MAG TPA: S9 family peptidase [Candidatus Saccharimonadales bacterium]|nr:S9 family peptidase [Candidatus Saccharimonadales bacterium]
MLSRLAFAIVICMSTVAAAQSFPIPQAVTDPAQLQSATVDNLQKFSISALYSTRLIGGSAWSPDGSRVAFISNISGRNNLWTVPSTGGWPTQLTISDQRQASPAWSPDGKWIAFMSDKDGNELWDIFLVSPQNGEVTNLTASPDSADEAPAWSPNGRTLAYMTKRKTSPSFEIDLIDIASRRTTHITRNSPPQLGNMSPLWSPDGKFIAYTQQNASDKDSNIFLYDLAAKAATNLTPHTGDQTFSAAAFSPDGKTLLLTSNSANGYDNVALLDIPSKRLAWITTDKWEIRASAFSPDGQSIVWSANVDGRESLYMRTVSGGEVHLLPVPDGVNNFAGDVSPFSHDGQHLLYHHSGARAPNDLHVFDFKSQHSTQLTDSFVAGLSPSSMVAPTLVHYPSKDGKFTLSAWAYIPNNIIRNQKYPAIVYIHGGPASQSMDGFNRFVQYMNNQGYLVIAPNYRGGTGYGREFQEANRHDAGGEELNDVLGAADFIQRTGFVDPAKLIVMGGSYGGYLTMMAVTRHPEMWAAGVPIVPFVNWFTEFENEDPQLQEYDRLFMGDPVKDKALWHDRSPINFIDRVKAPLLILAGGNDPRCPKTEAQQVADAIQKQGGTAILKIYENEGHGFARVENQIDAYQRVADFLRVRVPSPGCGCEIQ